MQRHGSACCCQTVNGHQSHLMCRLAKEVGVHGKDARNCKILLTHQFVSLCCAPTVRVCQGSGWEEYGTVHTGFLTGSTDAAAPPCLDVAPCCQVGRLGRGEEVLGSRSEHQLQGQRGRCKVGRTGSHFGNDCLPCMMVQSHALGVHRRHAPFLVGKWGLCCVQWPSPKLAYPQGQDPVGYLPRWPFL
jgi:hypothetical protein